MKFFLSLMIVAVVCVFCAQNSQAAAISFPKSNKSIYDFTMKTIDGQDKKLSDYKGKVVLIVNTASHCGFTPQYKGLEALYEQYKDKGLVILGFPENNFKNQEPGSNEEIKQFCALKYNVSFPMFAKISVKGSDIHPLYQYLTTETVFKGDITWNFNKFLISRDGHVAARFDSKTTPDSPEVVAKIKNLL